MNLFYSAEITSSLQNFTLPEEESAHCIRVLRMKKGDTIFFTNGKGTFFECTIEEDHPKRCKVKIGRAIPDTAKRKFELFLAVAPTKNIDRYEWFLEKATEIGCDSILPINCRHSERTVIKTDRLNKVIVAAMKQCLKSQLPQLQDLADFRQFIQHTKDLPFKKFIAHIPELSETEFPPRHPESKTLQHLCKKGESVLIAIGPEGGFSEEEVALAVNNGFTPVSLGYSRLRVETAGVMACSIVNAVNFEN